MEELQGYCQGGQVGLETLSLLIRFLPSHSPMQNQRTGMILCFIVSQKTLIILKWAAA